MADLFGIYREDLAPVQRDLSVPTVIKGKARVLNIKKKALGDVGNIVGQKAYNSKPNEFGGKPSPSCSIQQQDLPASCQSVVPAKEVVEDCIEEKKSCFCDDESDYDYDILPKSDRLSKATFNRITTFHDYSVSPPPSPKSIFDLDFPCIMSAPERNLLFDFEVPLGDVPLDDASLDDMSLEDVSYSEDDKMC